MSPKQIDRNRDRGTGTWNDEEYLTLMSVAAGTEPSVLKEKRRDHLRVPISAPRFKLYLDHFRARPPGRDLARLILEDLVTNELDPNGGKLDDRIKKISADFALSGGSDWNISIGIDRNQSGSSPFFVEVTRSDIYHDPLPPTGEDGEATGRNGSAVATTESDGPRSPKGVRTKGGPR